MKKLKLFMAAFALILGWSSAWAYQTPVADGIYYLYNTGCTSGETGFMSTGNGYGFQVVIDKFGFPVKLIDAGDGNFQFQFIHHEGFLSDDGFMYSDGGNTGENPRARTITLQHQGDGIYKLINTSNSKEIEQWYSSNVVGDGTGNRRNYLWQFLSKAERDAMVASYTTSVKLAAATSMGMPASVDTEEEFDEYLSTNYIALDQSSKITNGTFTTAHNTTDWSTTANENREFNIGWGNKDPKDTPEVYEGAGYLTHSTISVDKVGLYKVTVNATYRCGNAANNNRIGELGYDGSVAYLQANDNIAKVSDWYSGKINGNGPDSPSEANSAYFSQGKYLTDVYVYVDDAKTINISLHSHAMTWGGWLMFNNFKLTYYNDQVSDDDATAILTTATDVLDKAMLKATKDALSDAKTTFDGARTIANYNALNTAIENANASIAAYAPLGTKLTEAASVKSSVSGNSPSYVTTFDTNIAAITSDYNAGNYAESAISTQVAAVETEIIALVKSQTVAGSDMTRIVPNAACTGAAGDDNWKIKNALASGEYFRLDTWAGTASGMSVPMIEYWISNGNTLSSNEMYQTITGLSNGVYRVTAETAVNNESNTAPNAGSALLFANDATTDITTGGTQTSFKGQTGTFTVEGVVSDGSLSLGLKAVSPNYNWIAFKNVHLYYMGAQATSADYTALQNAIDAYDGATWGFETGEYAPYNNVEAINNFATAKAIDKEAVNSKLLVNSLTTKLALTANDGSVECVYNGNFAEGQGSPAANIQQYGWTRTNGWGQFRNDVYGSTTGYYNQPGSLQYGNAGVYTMPLEANTIYNLTFKYGSWEANSNDGMTVSVLNSEDGMAAMSFDAYKTKYTDGLATQSLVFVTGAAGNYILTLANSGNTVITGVSITKAASQVLEFADGSVPAYAPGTYPTVKITRTLTADMWATGVYPFAISGVDGLTTVNMSAFEGDVLTFSEGATVANQPFLMKASSTKSEISLTNVAVAATSGEANHTIGDITMKGVYADGTVSVSEESTYRYIVDSSNNTLRKVVDGGTGVTIAPYRAYFEETISSGGNEARSLIRMNFGGITGVENVEAAAEVAKKNGAYLENGKIAIYKNGEKFSATGAKLK